MRLTFDQALQHHPIKVLCDGRLLWVVRTAVPRKVLCTTPANLLTLSKVYDAGLHCQLVGTVRPVSTATGPAQLIMSSHELSLSRVRLQTPLVCEKQIEAVRSTDIVQPEGRL